MPQVKQINKLGGDHLYTDFRVYIEGIEVPFTSASVSTAMGDLPRATVMLPPFDGLVEIGKNYFPKIHIFYRDFNEAKTPYEIATTSLVYGEQVTFDVDSIADQESRSAYKLIFSGVITSVNESKTISGGSASALVTLDCLHPMYVLQEVALTFFGLGTEGLATNGANGDGSTKTASIGSPTMILNAMQGIYKDKDGIAKDANGKVVGDINGTPYYLKDYFDRLQGIPGVIVSLWNAVKRDAFNQVGTNSSEAATEMYIPLVETGLKMFMKLMGHPYLERSIQNDRVTLGGKTDPSKGSPEGEMSGASMMTPPFTKTAGFSSALVAEMVLQSMNDWMQTYQKLSFANLMSEFLNFCHYSIVFLASPVSRADGSSVETIVKPNLPFYYAPICNVVLPYMYDSFSINMSNYSIPTRMIFMSGLERGVGGNTATQLNYIAPHSVRVNLGSSLHDTLKPYSGKVGVYEWGTGIRSETVEFPMWYSLLNTKYEATPKSGSKDTSKTETTNAAKVDSNGVPIKEASNTTFEWDKAAAAYRLAKMPPVKQEELNSYGKAYQKAYPKGLATMNPWGSASGLADNQRMGFAIADQEYTMAHASSRSGQINGVFNPYIIAGYPMDIIDPSPQRDSYHGFCSSVTHSIDASGYSSTTIGMASAMSYTEMASCFIPAVEPWLAQVLGLDEDPRIFSNLPAYKIACQFYGEVLGVGAANPSMLQDLNTGEASPITRKGGVWDVGSTDEKAKDGVNTAYNLYYSTLGNLNLVARNIVDLTSVELDYCDEGQSFVDIAMWHDGQVEVKYIHNYTRTDLENIRAAAQKGGWELVSLGAKLDAIEKTNAETGSPTGIADGFREIEASPFLVYDKISPIVLSTGDTASTGSGGDAVDPDYEPGNPEISSKIIQYLVKKEDFRSNPYLDDAGYPTIGYGCRFYADGREVKMSDPAIDQRTGMLLMEARIANNIKILRKIPYWGEMDINKRNALISFSYNLGENFYYVPAKFATLNRALRTKDWANVPNALLLYNKAGGQVTPGLVTRRADEGLMWQGQGPYAE